MGEKCIYFYRRIYTFKFQYNKSNHMFYRTNPSLKKQGFYLQRYEKKMRRFFFFFYNENFNKIRGNLFYVRYLRKKQSTCIAKVDKVANPKDVPFVKRHLMVFCAISVLYHQKY